MVVSDRTEELTPKDQFLQSLERCSLSSDFLDTFYNRFLGSSEEIRQKFQKTDMDLQKQMLLKSLKLSAGATAGSREALAEISDRAESHDRNHLDIPPRLYAYWLDSLIASAERFDSEWDDSVEAAWRRILGHVINHMARKY